MKTNVGLWIDHRKAVIVSLGDKGEEIREIPSHMDKHVRYSGGANDTAGEDQRDRRFTGHLHKYYQKVVLSIRDADSILILGPGEAKGELKAHLEIAAFKGHIVDMETVDKMTDQQIAAKVRDHFLPSTEDIRQSPTH
jgi:stalled ribosome rescue protein Dom34